VVKKQLLPSSSLFFLRLGKKLKTLPREKLHHFNFNLNRHLGGAIFDAF